MPPYAKLKAAALLIFVSVVVYSNSLGGEFVYDDQYFVVKNLAIRSLENFPDYFTKSSAIAFADLSKDVYRPITTLSYALDYLLWRLDSFGYHLTNVVFHSANAVLVFLFLCALFGNIPAALIAGLLFALHPVQTEVVSWVSGRSSVLCLFFYLSSLIMYSGFARTGKVRYILSSVFSYVLALFSKEMAVTLPAVIIAYDLYFSAGEKARSRIGRYLPYIGATLAFILVRSAVLGRVSQCGWWGESPYYTLLTMSTVFAKYIWLLLYPAELCAFYTMNIFTTAGDLRVASSIALFVLLASSVPLLWRRHRLLSFSLCWFLVTLLPVSNIVPLKALIAERFLYIPSVGFCAAVAYSVFRLNKNAAVSLAVVIALLYGARTMARNEDWKSAVSISRSIVKVSPLNSWGWTSLGAAYLAGGMPEEAVISLKKAIALSRDYATPRNILGFSYLEQGRPADALGPLEEALRLDPKSVETLNSLGTAYAQLDRYDDARKTFCKAIAIDPAFVSAYLNLGAVYERELRYDKAVEQYSAIPYHTKSPPDIAISYIRKGDVIAKTGSPDDAAGYYKKALDICGGAYPDLRQVIEERTGKLKVRRRESP